MGALYRGVCYPTTEAAKKALCSDAGTFKLDGGDMYASACLSTDFTGPSYDVVVAVNGTMHGYHTWQYPDLLPCDHTYTTGLIGSWLLAAMGFAVLLWGARKLIDLFSGKYDA